MLRPLICEKSAQHDAQVGVLEVEADRLPRVLLRRRCPAPPASRRRRGRGTWAGARLRLRWRGACGGFAAGGCRLGCCGAAAQARAWVCGAWRATCSAASDPSGDQRLGVGDRLRQRDTSSSSSFAGARGRRRPAARPGPRRRPSRPSKTTARSRPSGPVRSTWYVADGEISMTTRVTSGSRLLSATRTCLTKTLSTPVRAAAAGDDVREVEHEAARLVVGLGERRGRRGGRCRRA